MSLRVLEQLHVSKQSPFKVFVGYDARHPVAYHVLCHSILTHASIPVALTAIEARTLRLFTRPRTKAHAGDQTFLRFLVPFLSGYRGLSLFLNGDMLCQGDVAELCDIALRSTKSVHVCAGEPCSSAIMFQNAACAVLMPEYVNKARVEDLHGFTWVDEGGLGALPDHWHWRVGQHPSRLDARLLHWESDGPWLQSDIESGHQEPGDVEGREGARHRWYAAREAMLISKGGPHGHG